MKKVFAGTSALLVLIAFAGMANPVNEAAPHKYSHEASITNVDHLAIATLAVTKYDVDALRAEIVSFEKPFVGYAELNIPVLPKKVFKTHITARANSPPAGMNYQWQKITMHRLSGFGDAFFLLKIKKQR